MNHNLLPDRDARHDDKCRVHFRLSTSATKTNETKLLTANKLLLNLPTDALSLSSGLLFFYQKPDSQKLLTLKITNLKGCLRSLL